MHGRRLAMPVSARRCLRLTAGALFVLFVVAACGSDSNVVADFSGDCESLGIDPATGAVRWERTIGDATGVALVEGVVVGAGASGAAFGVDASSGDLLWCQDFGRVDLEGNFVVPGFAASGGVVATAVDGGDVIGLDPRSGRELWRTSVGSIVGLRVEAGIGSFDVRDGRAANPHLLSLDAMTGTEVDQTSGPESEGEYLLAIEHPGIKDRQLLDVSVLRDDSELWSEQLPGFVAAIHGETVVVIDQTGGTGSVADSGTRITAYEASTGERRWQVPLPGSPHLMAEAGSMIVVPSGTALRAIDTQSGEIIWDSNPGSLGQGGRFSNPGSFRLLELDDSSAGLLIGTVMADEPYSD